VVLIVLLSRAAAIADEVFGNWMIFPGPNPDAADLLRDADPDAVFRIGQIIFEYPFDRLAKVDQPIDDLSKLQSVADSVKAATPGPSLGALVDQQLIISHEFHFESATILDRGDAGLMWNVTYELFPKKVGFSGVPFRYRAVLDGRGNLIPPRLTVFDAYFHSPKEGWTCSVLQLLPAVKDAALDPEGIRSRATKSLRNATKHGDAAKEVMNRMAYHGQKVIQIPIAADATGKLVHVEIWAVNFCGPSRKERPDELFTVWVTADGRTADIQHLDHWWDADEQKDEREPE
jgi:hypothetical protein